MLISIKGDNKPSIRNFLKSLKNKYNQDDIYQINHDEYSQSDIVDLIRSDGLFSDKKLIISSLGN